MKWKNPSQGDLFTEQTDSPRESVKTSIVGIFPRGERSDSPESWKAIRDAITAPVPGPLETPALAPLETEFLTGSAGTGKTYEVRRRNVADPDEVILAATTGIAAVNLGPQVTTIHSLLKFFDYKSLQENYERGILQRTIRGLVDTGTRELIVDEISMLSAPHLDLLYNAFDEVSPSDAGMKLTVVGDFCQLPPIADKDWPGTGKYAFEAECWRPNFSDKTTRLTRIWRQDHEKFVRALQAARKGAGEEALHYLQASGVRFEPRLNDVFEGTTVRATNWGVDEYNLRRLDQVPGKILAGPSTRWSFRGSEGAWDSIPDNFQFKIGAYVMILANDCPSFIYVNGDCGTVVGTDGDQIIVRLKRNDAEVRIGKIIRERTTRTRPPVSEKDIIVVGTKAEYNEMVQANGGEPLPQVVKISEPHPEWITGWISCGLRTPQRCTRVRAYRWIRYNSISVPTFLQSQP